MQLFSEYVQPITIWLEAHPHWALLFTFLVSFTESLAIVGSIIPGSVTMTAIGILAGSGIMRIDLTLLAAILGAVGGDSFSYLLGYTFRDRLRDIWPFSKNPTWLAYGQNYFQRHGGKSVLLGRFIGPLRSLIPLIAGMMRMSQWQFLTANVLSAIGWALLYVMPGIFIGAASSELSPEIATRLFIVVLIFLAGLWLITVTVKWLVIQLNYFLRIQLQDFWTWSGKHPRLAKLIQFLTPPGESKHYQTASLCLVFILSFFLFCLLSFFVIQGIGHKTINEPIHFFLQSLKTHPFDVCFISFSQFVSNLSLICLFAFILLIAIYLQDRRTLTYWLSLNFSCVVVLALTHFFIDSPRPVDLLEIKAGNSYPAIHLTFATAQFLAIIFFLNKYGKCRFNQFLAVLLPIVLLIAGIAYIYLGDNWVTDILGAYLAGLSISLLHWLLYRRHGNPLEYQPFLSPLLFLILMASTTFSLFINYETAVRSHQAFLAQYVFTDDLWWNQQKPLLPIFRTNRFGKNISLFNIQYAGNLSHLEAALLNSGWHKENESFVKSLVKRISGGHSSLDSPLMAQLYLNRKPALVMTYQPNPNEPGVILRMWRSNYHLTHFQQPIWLGSANLFSLAKVKANHKDIAINYVSSSVPHFLQRRNIIQVRFPRKLRRAPYYVEPVILLIKENPSFNEKKH
ncbi:Legionella secretion system protein Y [Legionella beliardensis]|uniref:Legionella secretion system protein Y n=1 Tax=Legionella beliardensis TaxID=91822 RepID=A0A378I2B5_9GAMM|nr:VTT domain-containing protein [Legionella beliardensis]STX29092.1 Legionella secretion system protein Y [Legionella beliardensis]